MAESADDKAVDECITQMQEALDRLKAEQAKDVSDEDGEDTPQDEQPKNLREARIRVREHFRKARAKARGDSDSY